MSFVRPSSSWSRLFVPPRAVLTFCCAALLVLFSPSMSAAQSGCHMEFRPTGAIDATYNTVSTTPASGTQSLRASCEGNCSGTRCPATVDTSDAVGTYTYCPECSPGGEPNCCHAIYRTVACPSGMTGTCYQASAKGTCGTSTCGAGDCQVKLQPGGPGTADDYYIGKCAPIPAPGGGG
ncbi:MAG: hypothetical protein NTY35_04460 [Planctomycetota bacterium]|nr:hypothetical protein [Planctomycetota bacterium]